MKKLVFNTTEKTVVLYSDLTNETILLKVNDTPTVKVCPEGFYEVMVKSQVTGSNMPYVRIPINEVMMFIQQ